LPEAASLVRAGAGSSGDGLPADALAVSSGAGSSTALVGSDDGAAPIEPIRKKRKQGVRAGWNTFAVIKDGTYYGDLVWNNERTQLNAHCGCAEHNLGGHCHLDKVLGAGRKAGQGRPVGVLLAWLFCGPDHDAQSHKKAAKKYLGSSEGFAERAVARAWAREEAEHGSLLGTILGLERDPESDEEDEPPRIAM
jgi:hypothetical protein